MPVGQTATSTASNRPIVAGVALSHHDRLIFPGVSKLDLARYYEAIERWIVPHVRGRPLTLLHCPRGAEGPCTFLRHTRAWGPTALRRVPIQDPWKDYWKAKQRVSAKAFEAVRRL